MSMKSLNRVIEIRSPFIKGKTISEILSLFQSNVNILLEIIFPNPGISIVSLWPGMRLGLIIKRLNS